MKKKLLSIISVLLLVALLAGCGGNSAEAPPSRLTGSTARASELTLKQENRL